MRPHPLALMPKEGGFFLGAGKGNAQVILVFQIAHGAAAGGLNQQALDLGIRKRCAHDGLNICGRFVFTEQLHCTHTVPANGLEQVKRLSAFRLESGGNP
jgi:hypothetical protein